MPVILEALERYIADDAARRGLELEPADVRQRAIAFARTGLLAGDERSLPPERASYPTAAARRRARKALERQVPVA